MTKLVKETINFERGANPRKAMNIGISVMLKKLKTDIIQILLDNYIAKDAIEDGDDKIDNNVLTISGVDIWYGPEKAELSYEIEATVAPLSITFAWNSGYHEHEFGNNEFTVGSLEEFNEKIDGLYSEVSDAYSGYVQAHGDDFDVEDYDEEDDEYELEEEEEDEN